MINSLYGKTMENLRTTIRLVNNEKDFLKYTSRPTHITHKIFDKNYVAIYRIKPVLMLNNPIYVEFTVLELSKWLIYDFHQSFIKKHFDAELSFTDTDILTYEIKSKDVYEEFFKHKHLFDLCNYPKYSKFFDETNKKVIGKMKDESEGKMIDEFVGIKSKMYSMKNIDGKESNTAKGVQQENNMRRIQGKNHKLRTYKINKISLFVFDGKRFVLNYGIHTLAYFHKDLENHR